MWPGINLTAHFQFPANAWISLPTLLSPNHSAHASLILLAWLDEGKQEGEFHVDDRYTYMDVEGKKYPKATFQGRTWWGMGTERKGKGGPHATRAGLLTHS